MNCPECGSPINETDNVCLNCESEEKDDFLDDDDVFISDDKAEDSHIQNNKKGLIVLIVSILAVFLVFSVLSSKKMVPEDYEEVIKKTIVSRLEGDYTSVEKNITKASIPNSDLGFENMDTDTVFSIIPVFKKLNGRYQVQVNYVPETFKKLDSKESVADYEITIDFYLDGERTSRVSSIESINTVYKDGRWLWDFE